MQFVFPQFLFALASIAIPIFIHLFNFRKFKKVYFTNVRFLSEIQQETKRQSELKQYLLLLFRILAFTALILAFAQPYIPGSLSHKRSAKSNAVSIYIDNSFSMEALTANGKLIDAAKAKAIEITSAYQESDVFQLLTNDFEGKHQRFVSKEEFRKLAEEVQPSATFRKLSGIITRQKDILSAIPNLNRDAFLISDFQKQFADFNAIKPDSAISWFLSPIIPQKRKNLYIDTLYFESPVHQNGQQVKLKIRIRNSGTEELEKIPVKLSINNIQKAIASFSISAGSYTDLVLPYTENSSGIQNGVIELADYPVSYDDLFYFSYPLLPSIPVLTINGKSENQYLNMMFRSDSSFTYTETNEKKVDYGNLPGFPLIILNGPENISSGLNQELSRYLADGGTLLVFPPENLNPDAYHDFFSAINAPVFINQDTIQQRVSEIALESNVFSDIFERNAQGQINLSENPDFPLVIKHYKISNRINSNQEVLMKLQNGHAFLTTATVGKGRIYLFASPMNEQWTNFPKHLLFLPTLYKIALLSIPSPKLFYLLGSEPKIELPIDSLDERKLITIKKNDADFTMIPETKSFFSRYYLFPHDQINEPGWYTVYQGKEKQIGLAFNYNRLESDLKCFSIEEIRGQLSRFPSKTVFLLDEKKSSVAKQMKEINQGIHLWKYFIILVLLFLITEMILIRTMNPKKYKP